MSEEKKSGARGRFNLLDVVLILLALLCILGVWQRSNLQRLFEGRASYETYAVTFEAERMDPLVAALLVDGTVFYTEQNGTKQVLGTLNGNVTAPSATEESAKQGYGGTLICHVLVKDNRYFLESGAQLALELELPVETEQADFRVVLTKIEKKV